MKEVSLLGTGFNPAVMNTEKYNLLSCNMGYTLIFNTSPEAEAPFPLINLERRITSSVYHNPYPFQPFFRHTTN